MVFSRVAHLFGNLCWVWTHLCHYDVHWVRHGKSALGLVFYCSLGQTCYSSSYCFYCYQHYDKDCWVPHYPSDWGSKCYRWTMKSGTKKEKTEMRSNQPSSEDYHSKWGITVSLFMSRAFTFLGSFLSSQKSQWKLHCCQEWGIDLTPCSKLYPMHHDYRGGSKQKVVQIATKVKVKLRL